MKYIITEEQDIRLTILRRTDVDWDWISQIVEEGVYMYNPCDYINEGDYLDAISKSSAETYLLNFLNDWQSNTFLTLAKYIQDLIEERLGEDVMENYRDLKPECE